MRKLIVTEFMSLDGVIENPMWTRPYWNDEIASFKAEETSANQALLLGRVTYEGFAEAWPQRTGDESGATYFNGTKKYVASTTLQKADWNNSEILKGDAMEAVAQLKGQDGSDLVVHGSGVLVQSLLKHGLVDRVRLLVYPVVLGKGQRLFLDGTTGTFKLVETRSFSSGVAGLIYETARD